MTKYSRSIFTSACILGLCTVTGIANRTTFAQVATTGAESNQGESHGGKDATAIWRLQAETVAKELKLTNEQTEKLVEAYVESRERRRTVLNNIPKPSEDKDTKRSARDKIDAEQQEALKKSLAGFLSDQQIESALLPLGSFNARWDSYVETIRQFELPEQKQNAALHLIYEYISNYVKARNAAKSQGARFSSVTARELKSTLDAGVAKLLSDEQLAKWNKETAFRSGGSNRSAGSKGKQHGIRFR